MSTKNLARTVLEGGRYSSWKHNVNDGVRSERAGARSALRVISRDPEAADDVVVPTREKMCKRGNQTDKLSPVWAFVDSRCGKSWAKVYKEICQKFPVKSLAGYHVVFGHMLKAIKGSGTQEHLYGYFSFEDYFIDPQGILRKNKKKRWSKNQRKKVKNWDVHKTMNWLDGHKICKVGDKYYWMDHAPEQNLVAIWSHGSVFYVVGAGGIPLREPAVGMFEPYRYNPSKTHWVEAQSRYVYPETRAWRQGKELRKVDVEYLLSLPEQIRDGLVTQFGK